MIRRAYMKILIKHDLETIRYAAEELSKYLYMMDGITADISFDEGDIELGFLSDFSLSADDVDDAMIDDVIDVNIDSLKGYIAGSNERSILMGVYNYLKSAGCMWVRPGKDGEYIPKADMSAHKFVYRKKADVAFRGECIEGAVSFEHVRDTILWLPKVNMNLFMLEQVVPYNYISRWYKHEISTVKSDENVSFEEISEYVIRLEKTVKKCGLQLHSLGHGYLFEPYGIHYKTSRDKYELTEKAREHTALVNGKREFYHNSPNFTQLCFSNDEARLGLVNWLADYLEKKPYIDFLHVWLSDSINNHCECENCKKKTPTDFYVQMLNELDAELTKRNNNAKIVFIMYIDTYWAPEVDKFNNPDRFIFTTAAVSRSYNTTYNPKRYEGKLPAYKRNDLNIPHGFDCMLSFMDAWKPAFDGRKFLFEYHMYTDHYFDPGYMSVARGNLEDAKSVGKIGFDGIMDDKTQRSYFPTGLPMSVMGEGMFDTSLVFDEYAESYFKAAFGAEWKSALDYLETVTKLFEPKSLRVLDSIVFQDTNTGNEVAVNPIKGNKSAKSRFEKIAPYVDSFAEVVERNLSLEDECQRTSWKYLTFHREYCKYFADICIALTELDKDKASSILDSAMDYLSKAEDEIAPVFDLVLFKQRMKQLIAR